MVGYLTIIRPWYNLAKILNTAATIPSQKGNWKLSEIEVSTLALIKKFDGTITIVEPKIGTLIPNSEAIEVKSQQTPNKSTDDGTYDDNQ